MECLTNFINGSAYLFIKDIVTLVIAVITLFFAARGLNTWKEQTKGLKAYEIVQNLHLALLHLREAIGEVRNPGIWQKENRRALEFAQNRYPERTKEEVEKRLEEHVYEMRWEKIKDALSELESHLLGAEMLWGQEIKIFTRPFYEKVGDLNNALMSKFSEEPWVSQQEMRKFVYDHSSWEKDDEFKREINSAIQRVVEYLKSKIA